MTGRRTTGVGAWHVYIVRCRDGTLYTGIAKDLERRLAAHDSGTAAKYTRSRRPVSLLYQERQPNRSHALRREAALRRLGRSGKLALIGKRRELVERSNEPAERSKLRPRRRATSSGGRAG